jgi:hypothetical protein
MKNKYLGQRSKTCASVGKRCSKLKKHTFGTKSIHFLLAQVAAPLKLAPMGV